MIPLSKKILLTTVLQISFLVLFSQLSTLGAISVANLDRSAGFFCQILRVTEQGRFSVGNRDAQSLFGTRDSLIYLKGVRLTLGNESVELLEVHSSWGHRRIPVDSRANDQWFQHIAIVVSDIDSAYALLRKAGVVQVSSSPQTLPDYIPAAAGIRAFYFRDPDGHNLELIHYPPGNGNPRWQDRDKLFLGIGHTALTVGETSASVGFYRTLGFPISGKSENFGTEQEHLNQVLGARVSFTSMGGHRGLGTELLQFLAPPEGHSYPADTSPSDLVYWHTAIWVSDLSATLQELRMKQIRSISRGDLKRNLPPGSSYRQSFLVRDPDGHFIIVYH